MSWKMRLCRGEVFKIISLIQNQRGASLPRGGSGPEAQMRQPFAGGLVICMDIADGPRHPNAAQGWNHIVFEVLRHRTNGSLSCRCLEAPDMG